MEESNGCVSHTSRRSTDVCRTGLPWPLRGVRRWTDADVLRVNGRTVKFQEAVACLELMWTEVPIAQRLVNACLLDAELEGCGSDPEQRRRDPERGVTERVT